MNLPVWLLGCDDSTFQEWHTQYASQCKSISLRAICNNVSKLKPMSQASNAALVRMWNLLQGSRIAWSHFLDAVRKEIDLFAETLQAKPLVIHVPRTMVPKILLLLNHKNVALKTQCFFVIMPTQATFDAIAQQNCATWDCEA